MESTHIGHLREQNDASLMTQDLSVRSSESENPDANDDDHNSSNFTEDLTVYHSAKESMESQGQVRTPDSISDKSRDCLETLDESQNNPLQAAAPPSMTAKVLFSIGKRRSMLPKMANSATILAGDSNDDDEEEAEDDLTELLSVSRRRTKNKLNKR